MTEIRNLDKLLDAIGVAQWVPKKILGLPDEGWFLLEIDPTPLDNQIIEVTSDLLKDEYVAVENGKVFHSDICKASVHNLKSQWKKAIQGIKKQTFKVAMYPGNPAILHGQPLVVVLDPPISYAQYPDHKHLNTGRRLSKSMIIPDTLCYTDDPAGLGVEIDDRVFQAYKYITVWLYRHQLWLASRDLPVDEKWIGPQIVNHDISNYVGVIDPIGKCRCGSQKQYMECHMSGDYAKYRGVTLEESKKFISSNRGRIIQEYAHIFAAPRTEAKTLLIENLL